MTLPLFTIIWKLIAASGLAEQGYVQAGPPKNSTLQTLVWKLLPCVMSSPGTELASKHVCKPPSFRYREMLANLFNAYCLRYVWKRL